MSHSPTGIRRIPVALIPLAAFLLAVAFVPDEAVLRTKVVWGWALIMATAATVLIAEAARDRLGVRWPRFLLAALAPGLLAVLWFLGPESLIRSLAGDEVRRLLCVPVVVWAVSSCLGSPTARRLFLLALMTTVIPVAGYALAQKLAGTLNLPVDSVARSASTFGNPVFLGAYFVLMTPLCAAGALYGTGLVRWAGAVATGLALPALLATESRWAWMGFAVSLVVGVVLLAPSVSLRRRLLLATLAVGIGLAAFSSRVMVRPQGPALIWRDTAIMIASRPWGVGPGQFDVAFLPYASPELLAAYPRATTIINDAHCEPLQVLAELGWAGFVILLVVLWELARAARRTLLALPADDPERPFLVAALASLAGAAAQSLGSPDLRFMVSTLLLATVAGFAASFAAPRPLRVPFGRAGKAGLVAVGALGLFILARNAHADLQLASLVKPQAPFEPSPAAAARIEDLQQLVLDQPNDPMLRYQLGAALAEERYYASAAIAFRDAARLSGGGAAAIRSLGIAESLAGQHAEAVPHLRAALADNPADDDVRYLLAYSSYGLGEIGTAITELEILLAKRPDHPQARLLLGKLRE